MAKGLLLVLALFLSLFVSAFSEEHLGHGHAPYHVMAPAPAPEGHHHHHHHKAPAPSPTKPPSHHHHHAPSHPPAVSPVHHHAPAVSPVQPPSHHHAPTPSPVYPPKKAPIHPPSNHHVPAPAPVHPPTVSPAHPPIRRFPRSFVAVQGVVYCKSCKYAGVDTFQGASPLLGAGVKLVCNNTKFRPAVVQTKTDKNGYFYMEAPKTVTSYASHTCKVLLVSSPSATCNKVSPHQGKSAGTLRPEKQFQSPQKLPYALYSVGPFAFEPICKHN